MRFLYGVLLLGAFAACKSDVPVQPMEFSHAVHAGQEAIPCVDCHRGAEKRAEASLPALGVCLNCHMRPQGDSGRDQVVRDQAGKGGAFRWVQVTRNPGHVYFSHRAHVSIAKMECSECHGQVSTWAQAPTQPNPELVSMDACMDCHRKRAASNACLTCHR